MRLATLVLILISLSARSQEIHIGNKVTLNSDNVLVINGRKVFPIGFTMAPPPDGKTPSGKNGIQELAEAGGTFFRTGARGGNWDEQTIAMEQKWQDAAARHGMYCWVFLRELADIKEENTRREALLRRVVINSKTIPEWVSGREPMNRNGARRKSPD